MRLLRSRVDPSALVVALVTALTALLGIVSADSRWLAALGREIVDRGEIPDGVPFAALPTQGWQNVPVLAELVLHALEAGFGDSGLLLAQVVAVAAAFAVVAWDARREGARGALAPVLLLVAFGAFTSLLAVRAQLFSFVLFPVTMAFLRAEARTPSRRLWLLVPLVALWSNLHGAVLAGLAAAGAYLVVERARHEPIVAAAVLAASVAALAATPALGGTADYYRGVLGNEAKRQGAGQWMPLSLHEPLHLVLIIAAGALLVLALRARPRIWELVALAGLGVLTVQAARGGLWLVLAAAVPAARGAAAAWMPSRVPALAVLPLVALCGVGIAKGPVPYAAGDRLVREAIDRAAGTPVLADDLPAEQVALDGGRVLVSNPLDAFRGADQRLYVDWLEGRPAGDAALGRVRVVLVMRESRAQRRMATRARFRELVRDRHAVLYVRR